jgi:hypothetical protein
MDLRRADKFGAGGVERFMNARFSGGIIRLLHGKPQTAETTPNDLNMQKEDADIDLQDYHAQCRKTMIAFTGQTSAGIMKVIGVC